MVLIPLLQVICTAVVLVYAEPEGKALIVFSYRLERFVFQFFSNFLVDSYQRNIKTFLGFSLISRRGDLFRLLYWLVRKYLESLSCF